MTITEQSSMDVITIDQKTAFTVFTSTGAIDPILNRIRSEIDAFEPDISTASGRKAVASMAYKVAKAKTILDNAGKNLADIQKEIPKKIDATRKRIRDTLDQWKDEVRKPLTEWEAAEDDRVSRIKTSLSELQAVIDDKSEHSAASIRERMSEVEREAITEQFYCEYIAAAAELKDRAIFALKAALVIAETREREQAELARLRAENEAFASASRWKQRRRPRAMQKRRPMPRKKSHRGSGSMGARSRQTSRTATETTR